MVAARPIAEATIDAIAAGVFAKPDPFVSEAISQPDQEPREFTNAADLAAYIKERISQPRGLANLVVVYPDMGGRAVRRTIHLDPSHCPGQKLRYTWEGWGLILIQLYGSEQAQMSRICSNSPARARTWASTYPELSSPDEWNWKSVTSHTRRLQRIFKRVT